MKIIFGFLFICSFSTQELYAQKTEINDTSNLEKLQGSWKETTSSVESYRVFDSHFLYSIARLDNKISVIVSFVGFLEEEKRKDSIDIRQINKNGDYYIKFTLRGIYEKEKNIYSKKKFLVYPYTLESEYFTYDHDMNTIVLRRINSLPADVKSAYLKKKKEVEKEYPGLK